MYGSLPNSEQLKVFRSTPRGLRKIVVATNIAETSITIPGIVYGNSWIILNKTVSTYEQSHQLMHFLLTAITSRQMFWRLMSPSSRDTHCEECWTSMWFITGVLSKIVHNDTFGSTGSNNSIHIKNTSPTLGRMFKIYKITCTCR
jgi:hypothetical protein